MTVHLGLTQQATTKTIDFLKIILADTFIVYTKTLNFHWNVTGSHFTELHTLFQNQYEELALSIDEIAERIRTLGFQAPGTLKTFLELTTLTESEMNLQGPKMIHHLAQDYEHIIIKIRHILREIDEQDTGSRALLEDLLSQHEKTFWMLTSHL